MNNDNKNTNESIEGKRVVTTEDVCRTIESIPFMSTQPFLPLGWKVLHILVISAYAFIVGASLPYLLLGLLDFLSWLF